MTDQLNAIELSGTPRERGNTHGESLRKEIFEGINRWTDHISERLDMSFQQIKEEFLGAVNFLPSIEKASPDLLEEITGISEGSNLDFDLIFLWQLAFDESWHYIKKKLRDKSHSSLCSAFACAGNNGTPTIVGHTSDLPYYFDGCQTLLKISYPETEFQSLIFTIAGVLFQTGINNLKMSLVANSLSQLNYSKTGIPGSFFLRKLIESRSISEAVDFARNNKPAVGLNVILADPQQVVDLECSPAVISQYSLNDTINCICHTNHPLVNQDKSMLDLNYGYPSLDPEIDDPFPSFSDKRLDYLYSQIKKRTTNKTTSMSLADAISILGSHEAPICFCRGTSETSFTFGSSLFQLGSEPLFYLAPGPPGETPYQLFSF